MLKDLVLANRSYRRYYEEKRISDDLMKELVKLGHMTPSGANRQPVRFHTENSKEGCARIFETLRWAGYYKEWDGPVEGERPSGYIVLAAPEGCNCQQDEGIIGQTILLGAVEAGLGGCFIGNINRTELADLINLPEGYTIRLVIALGVPKEQVVIDMIDQNGDIKYYRDENQVHHVPKIKVEDVMF